VANFSWADDGSDGVGPERGFIQRSGPSVRFAAELADGDVRWRAVLPGGQSGYPGDPHYMDQVPAWLANEQGVQPYTRADVEKRQATKILLEP
jgi:penicillin amidase